MRLHDFPYWTKQSIFVSSFVRMLAVVFFGLSVVALSGLAYFQSYRVFYNPSKPHIPIFECPTLVPNMLRSGSVNQGRYCQVTLYNWARTPARNKLLEIGETGTGYSCSVPHDEFTNEEFDKLEAYSVRNPIVCNVKAPCSQVRSCSKKDSPTGVEKEVSCPRGPEEAYSPQFDQPELRDIYIELSPPSAPVPAYMYYPWNRFRQAHFTEFCDSGFTMSVGKILAMRALIASVIFLSILWFFVDLFLTILKRKQVRCVAARLTSLNLDEVEEIHNRNIKELIWMNTQIYPPTTAPVSGPISRSPSIVGTPRSGMVSRVITPVLCDSPVGQNFFGSPSPSAAAASFKVAVCSNPFKAFSSLNWYSKVISFNENFHKVGRGRSRVIYLSIPLSFLLVGFLICICFLALTPGDLVNTHSIADVLFSSYSTIWRAKSTWIILPFLFLDELYEILLFLIESLLVRWGTETVFANYTTSGVEEDEKFDDDEIFDDLDNVDQDDKEGGVISDKLIPDGVVAVVCVDGLRLNDDEEFITNIKITFSSGHTSIRDGFSSYNTSIVRFSRGSKFFRLTITKCCCRRVIQGCCV